MGESYSQLTLEDRCRIRGLMEQGLGVAAIARRLDRHRSTIYRELARNTSVRGYDPERARRRAWGRRLRGSRIARSTRLRSEVEDRLAMGWSPEQIVGRMERERSEHRISVESIYRHVHSPEGRKAGLPRLLAQRKCRRGRGRRRATRQPIPDRVPIQARPEKANDRSQLGHWEGDLMHFGRGGETLLTLVDRCSRLTLARRLRGRDSDGCARAIVAELAPLPPPARRSITHDNGGEFAAHGRVTLWTGMPAYFGDPGCPGQRGSIENTNGRLRRPLPRRTDLAALPDAAIADAVARLNRTPRKCLGWRTPLEAFSHALAAELKAHLSELRSVALEN